MKRIVTALLAIFICTFASAKVKARFNVEWGAGSPINEWHMYHYLSEEGMIIVDDDESFISSLIAMNTIGAGADIGRHFSLLLCTGYAGLKKGDRFIPLTLRAYWLPRGTEVGGLVTFLEGGSGFHTDKVGEMPSIARIGAGYRLQLNKRCGIDFTLSVRYSKDNPAIIDSSTGEIVPEERVLKSEERMWAPMLTIAVNF